MKTVPRILRAVAVLQNKAGDFVQPEADSGSEALAGTATIDQPGGLRLFLPNPDRPGSHPLVSLSWILLYEEYSDPAKAAAFKDALVWGLTEEQPIAEEMGYIPLPEAITSKAIRVLAGCNSILGVSRKVERLLSLMNSQRSLHDSRLRIRRRKV